MEGFDLKFGRTTRPAFDCAPERSRTRLFGVDYLHLKGLQGGDLFCTRQGWESAESLLPQQWFAGEAFRKSGRALAGATGAVYRVPAPHRANPNYALVVKFSRFGQDIGGTVALEVTNMDPVLAARLAGAQFLPPFEEFGHLCRLSADVKGRLALMTPLAIYSPPTRYLEWELGRKSYLRRSYNRRLEADQEDIPAEDRFQYDWERLYILLYRWLDGFDVEEAFTMNLLSRDEMAALAAQTSLLLRETGWIVLDHKPRHLILRRNNRNGSLLRRNGRLVMGIIDYELLVPV